ncbi:hypothetical protein [Enterovirga aerilata]|nr:hypothetical protein [Enterovirga sp. DB1703]
MAVMMVLISITLALPGDTLERAALRGLSDVGFTESNMAAIFGAIGALRGFALWANGNINHGRITPQGAMIRAWCCVVGAVIWGQMTLALFRDAFYANAPSLGIPLFGTLTMFELLSAYRARHDAVQRRSHLGRHLDALANRS